MKKLLAVFAALSLFALGSAGFAAAAPSAGELRGCSTAFRTLERLGFPLPEIEHPEDLPFRDFDLARDTAILALQFDDSGTYADISAYSPADLDALFALYASEGWANEPDTPEGFRVFVPPSRTYTNYHALVNGKLLGSESPDALRAAVDALPTLPALLPAEGDIVLQFPGKDLAEFFGSDFADEADIAEMTENVATVTGGLGIDGDTAALQIVAAPVPGSELAGQIAACGPIDPSTACVNLPGAIAFISGGPSPSETGMPGIRSPFLEDLARYCAGKSSAAAFFPPARPGALPRALHFLAGVAPSARADLLLRVARHHDAFSVDSAEYRGIPVDTVSVDSPDALAPLLERFLGFPSSSSGFFAWALASPLVSCRVAWLPDGLLAAFADNDSALLNEAIDAALDGTAVPFEQSRAFRDAFPYPDAPAHLLAHLDLHSIAALQPVIEIPIELPDPCPVDLFAYVTSDNFFIARIRAPVALVRTIATAIPGGAGGSPAASVTAASECPASESEATPLSPTPFRGYPEAYVLHNDDVHAVIVPAISRLAFLAPSPDAPNLLRFDDALADAGALPPDPSTAPDFFNIGGDWVWPVAQSNWPAFSPNASDWPPPPALADGPSTVKAWVDADGTQLVNLVREYPPPVSVTLERTFILESNASQLVCKQILYAPVFEESENDLPLSLWHISQVANPDSIHFTVPSPDFTPAVMAGTLFPGSFVVESEWHGTFIGGTPLGHPATYTPPPSSEVKLLLPISSLSARTPNGLFTVTVSDTTPDAHAELYSNTGLGYAELETVTPDYSSVPHVSPLANTLVYSVFSPPNKSLVP